MKQKDILIIILLISIIVVIVNNLICNDIPELINIGNEIGQILSNLSLAYISSYIFYLVVVVVKEKKDKKNVYKSVFYLTDLLIDYAYGGIFREIVEATNTETNKYDKKTISREQYYELCEKCDPSYIPKDRYFGSPFQPQYANIAQFIYNFTVTQPDKTIEKIFEFMPFLDTDFIALLNKLRESQFFKRDANLLLIVAQGNVPDKKIGKWDSMYEYLKIVREIELYNKRNHLKFKT